VSVLPTLLYNVSAIVTVLSPDDALRISQPHFTTAGELILEREFVLCQRGAFLPYACAICRVLKNTQQNSRQECLVRTDYFLGKKPKQKASYRL
jgi:hypothetical protein